MSASQPSKQPPAPGVVDLLKETGERVAPTWPLDQLIAVNPFWEMRSLPYSEVATQVAALSGGKLFMSAADYQALAGSSISDAALEAAAQEEGVQLAAEDLRGHLAPAHEAPQAAAHWHNISDLLDQERDHQHQMTWAEEITQQISQLCARTFQEAPHRGQDLAAGSLYGAWLASARSDRGLSIIMGTPGLRQYFQALPESPQAVFEEAARALDLTPESATLYGHALLLSVNGWASWVAYLRWQQRLSGSDSLLMDDLLAIRLAWELVLWHYSASQDELGARRLGHQWRTQNALGKALLEPHRQALQAARVWLRAAERSYQRRLHQQLGEQPQPDRDNRPLLQAVFCIDVRSEVLRRHLEAQHPDIQTLGFAGFFGLPIAYAPAGAAYERPQLPGLLSPALTATEATGSTPLERQNQRARWADLMESPAAMFPVVEATGPLFAANLLRDSFFPGHEHHPVNELNQDQALTLERDGCAIDSDAKSDIASTVLNAMGLTRNFAPLVLLCGHGCSSRNNPQAAGLECGACGGQSGELNARALTQILNDEAVRATLSERGIVIPEDTRFLPAIHNTTTDDVKVLGCCTLPKLTERWLTQAAECAREERAETLGLEGSKGSQLTSKLRRRARDWSQIRPEWGLANNAAFIAAPRARTRGLDLEGRTFLHDYRWQDDHDLSVLTLIMTAPMVVAHWINAQYNASVTDPERYGSGNKVLHNVVGGNIGVFEGNGGDLRIGLPRQSVHDGKRWMHQPQRLSVYLLAPAQSIQRVYREHEAVRELVDNEWVYLHRIGQADEPIERLYEDRWLRATGAGQ